MTTKDLESRLSPWLARWALNSTEGVQRWFSRMTLAQFAPDEHLVNVGDVGDTLFLLDEGLVRLFYVSPDGKERNKAFFSRGQITGPVSAAISAAPAPFAIAALEPTVAITFRYADLIEAAADNPEIARLHLTMLSNAFIRNEQREAMLLTLNAQQRYQWLLDKEPELLERVTQFHIASYLGVDAVSLSRIKRKIQRAE